MAPIRTLLAAALCTAVAGTSSAAQQPWAGLPSDVQIQLAVQAAPADVRDGATVQGYDERGEFVALREGSGEMICMAPAPDRERFEVSCHHEELEPFFARGRELAAEGIVGQERVQARWREYAEGVLPIPYGAINYILTGSGFDPATGEVRDPYLRWTIYTPNATPGSTGITTDAGAGGPWLMFPGTPGSHIMITPPRGGR